MQTVLEQGSIDKPLTFDVGLIQLSFIPVCSLNTCNISVKLCRGFAALQCFSLCQVLPNTILNFKTPGGGREFQALPLYETLLISAQKEAVKKHILRIIHY